MLFFLFPLVARVAITRRHEIVVRAGGLLTCPTFLQLPWKANWRSHFTQLPDAIFALTVCVEASRRAAACMYA